MRRCKSVTRAEEIQSVEAKVRKSQPDQPCHSHKDSLFSWSSGFDNFSGLINLAFLLLSLVGVRLLLENLIKYGVLVNPVEWADAFETHPSYSSYYPSLYLIAFTNVEILLSYGVVLLASQSFITDIVANIIHATYLLGFLILPIICIGLQKEAFALIGATAVCFIYSLVFLKLWSYAHVNHWCSLEFRQKKRMKRQRSFTICAQGKRISSPETEAVAVFVKYPDNITLRDLYYFMLAPTLCYELNFPRSGRIRKRFLIRRLLEVVVGMNVVLALIQQWIIPSVKNSLVPFSNMNIIRASERLLKLAVPNHLIWLICFYLYFHALLNLIGELLRFADRDFYGDWWNAQNIDYFWRTWNLPVHRWAIRHLYKPLAQSGYSKVFSTAAVFLLSAFMHEYLVSVPLNLFKVWAFTGMMFQLPLSVLSRYAERRFGGRFGNILMWASLILGQPLCIMMYYHDVVIQNLSSG